jgi:hypothetical protein
VSMESGEVIAFSGFVDRLLAAVPEVDAEVREHLSDYDGELLIHLLMGDLRRTAVRLFHDGAFQVEQRLLRFVDLALRQGDDAVENAVCVSFVENAGFGPGETPEFIASWPDGLRSELDRQRAYYRQRS